MVDFWPLKVLVVLKTKKYLVQSIVVALLVSSSNFRYFVKYTTQYTLQKWMNVLFRHFERKSRLYKRVPTCWFTFGPKFVECLQIFDLSWKVVETLFEESAIVHERKWNKHYSFRHSARIWTNISKELQNFAECSSEFFTWLTRCTCGIAPGIIPGIIPRIFPEFTGRIT